MQSTENKVVRVEEVVVLSDATEQQVRDTLKRTTLYRVATRLTGCARKAQMPKTEEKLRCEGNALVRGEDYDSAYYRIAAIWRDHQSDLYIKPLLGTAISGDKSAQLTTLDEVLDALRPTNYPQHLSLSMAQRYIRFDVAPAAIIEQPSPAPGIGYVRTFIKHADELQQMLQSARQVFGTCDQQEVIIRGVSPLLYFRMLQDDGDPVYLHFANSLQK